MLRKSNLHAKYAGDDAATLHNPLQYDARPPTSLLAIDDMVDFDTKMRIIADAARVTAARHFPSDAEPVRVAYTRAASFYFLTFATLFTRTHFFC